MNDSGSGVWASANPNAWVRLQPRACRPGVDHQPHRPPGRRPEHAQALQVIGVQAQLVGQLFGVQPPALTVGHHVEGAQQQWKVGDQLEAGELGVVARHPLMERRRLQPPAARRSGVDGVEQVGTGSTAVAGWRGVHRRRAGGGQLLGHGLDGAGGRQGRGEHLPQPLLGPGDDGGRSGHRISAGRGPKGGALAHSGQHLPGVSGIQDLAAQLGDALLHLGQRRQAKAVEFLGI
jgi:hypothetical protein